MSSHATIADRVAEYENPIVDIITNDQSHPEWLIPGLMLQGWLGCLAGAPSSGKSFISYTLALAVASGQPALGGLIPAGPPRKVLYFDQENAEQDRNRYVSQLYLGLARANGVEPDLALLHQNFWPVGFWLGDPQWEETAREFVLRLQPQLIVFDTATPCFDIRDENSNAEAGQVINKLTRLQRLVNPTATIVVLRHENVRKKEDKGQRRSMRGAKGWLSWTHGTIYVIRTGGRPRKYNLFLSRIEPDKVRAYGLQETYFLTPEAHGPESDPKRALVLHASLKASPEHKKKLAEEGEDED